MSDETLKLDTAAHMEIIVDLERRLAEMRAERDHAISIKAALEKAREEIVLAIAFLGRDEGTERMATTVPALISRLVEADKTAIAALRRVIVDPAAEPATLIYTNYRGETSERTITPKAVYFGSTEWHSDPQWLLRAFDHDKQAERDFALKDFGNPADTATKTESAFIESANDEAVDWISKNLGAMRRDSGSLEYSLSQVIRAYQAGAASTADKLKEVRSEIDTKLWHWQNRAKKAETARDALLADHARKDEALTEANLHLETLHSITGGEGRKIVWAAIKKVRAAISPYVTAPAVLEPAKLIYTNYRGETSERTITPKSVYFGSTEWHPKPQWLLRAYDHEKQSEGDFALKDFGGTANNLDEAIETEGCVPAARAGGVSPERYAELLATEERAKELEAGQKFTAEIASKAIKFKLGDISIESRGLNLWAVTNGSSVRNSFGEWERDPSPSNRDEGFISRTCLSFHDAWKLASTLEKEAGGGH